MASKANANMLANQQKQQQLLINQFAKGGTGGKIELSKEAFERTVDVSGNLAGRGQLNRGSQGTPQ